MTYSQDYSLSTFMAEKTVHKLKVHKQGGINLYTTGYYVAVKGVGNILAA